MFFNDFDFSLKVDKIKEEEQIDGYYSIVTSELKMSDKELHDVYKELWKIEESFKITQSSLETRSVYVWTKEHIKAHFLTCFASLIKLRLLKQKINRKYFIEKVTNSLKKWSCSKIEHDIYLNIYYSEEIQKLLILLNIDLSNKYLELKILKIY